jgi:hypothetical protein
VLGGRVVKQDPDAGKKLVPGSKVKDKLRGWRAWARSESGRLFSSPGSATNAAAVPPDSTPDESAALTGFLVKALTLFDRVTLGLELGLRDGV